MVAYQDSPLLVQASRLTFFEDEPTFLLQKTAGEDARLLHELEGISEEDVTNLDDFQCYVKLSLHGHRLPVFSLNLDAPPRPDEGLAQLVRLRNQERNGRPVGVVDELIRHIQARQKSAVPTKQYVSHMGEATVVGYDRLGAEEDRSRRHKKRGGSNRKKPQERVVPSHMHLMFGKGDERESPEAEGEEHDSADA